MKKKTYVGWTFTDWHKHVGYSLQPRKRPRQLSACAFYQKRKEFHEHYPEEGARKIKITIEEV